MTTPEITYGPVSTHRVLKAAQARDLREVVVLGFETDGSFYAASSTGLIGDNLHLIEKFRHFLMHESFKTSRVAE